MSFFDAVRGYFQDVQNVKDAATLENITSDDIVEVEAYDVAKSCNMWNEQMEAATRLDKQGLLSHDGKTWRSRR